MCDIKKYITIILIVSYALAIKLFITNTLNIDNITISYISCLSLIVVFFSYRINNINLNSICYFFLIAYATFIFGRFISIVIDSLISNSNEGVVDLFRVTWMTTYNPNPEDAKKLFIIVNYFILFFACGFILNGKIVFSNINRKKINFKYCYYFFYICILYLSIKLCNDIILTIKGGYQALYIQGNNAGVFSGTLVRIAKLILLITFLIIINDTEPKKCNKYFIIFIVFSLLTGFVGSRGTLVTYILTIFYLYNRKNNKKLNILMFSSCVLGVFILMNVILGFSSRGGQDSDFILNTSVITGFLNSQGVSLSVIGYSLYGINEYPLHTLLQSVIPLFFKIYSLFNSDVEMYTSSITTYIAYNANYHMFLQGAGLGSSIVSELFLLVNYELLIFIICSVFFGFIIGFVEKKSINSSYCFILIGTMMPFILFSPRDGLNVLIISTIYCLLIIVLFRMKIKKKV